MKRRHKQVLWVTHLLVVATTATLWASIVIEEFVVAPEIAAHAWLISIGLAVVAWIASDG